MLGPWVILQFGPDFGFIPSIEDQHRAAFIDEGTAHQNVASSTS
jgi:hypothetical protein